MAALDRKLREETQFELMDLQARLGLTFVIVPTIRRGDDGLRIASRDGSRPASSRPQRPPKSTTAAVPMGRAIVGDVNLIDGLVLETGAGEAVIGDKSGRRYRVAADVAKGAAKGAQVSIALRPEKVRIQSGPARTMLPCDARPSLRYRYLVAFDL